MTEISHFFPVAGLLGCDSAFNMELPLTLLTEDLQAVSICVCRQRVFCMHPRARRDIFFTCSRNIQESMLYPGRNKVQYSIYKLSCEIFHVITILK